MKVITYTKEDIEEEEQEKLLGRKDQQEVRE